MKEAATRVVANEVEAATASGCRSIGRFSASSRAEERASTNSMPSIISYRYPLPIHASLIANNKAHAPRLACEESRTEKS